MKNFVAKLIQQTFSIEDDTYLHGNTKQPTLAEEIEAIKRDVALWQTKYGNQQQLVKNLRHDLNHTELETNLLHTEMAQKFAASAKYNRTQNYIVLGVLLAFVATQYFILFS
jgi:hypothetical protein